MRLPKTPSSGREFRRAHLRQRVLAGLIKEAPRSFRGGRFAGARAQGLLENHAFRLALSPRWLDPLPEGIWVLVVMSEAKMQTSKLAEWVDRSLKPNDEEAIEQIKEALAREARSIIRVGISDTLELPGMGCASSPPCARPRSPSSMQPASSPQSCSHSASGRLSGGASL